MADASEFSSPWWLRNPHLMTLVPRYWPRPSLRRIPQVERLFTTEPTTQLLGLCHWQPNRHAVPTLVLVHGLEGSADSHYMRGLTLKAYHGGFNVVRMNQRTCGGSDHLTPTLYNSGMSRDYRAILQELSARDGLTKIRLIGYSMGGNLALKAAGELGDPLDSLAGVAAVSPSIDPAQCVAALELSRNRLYHDHFLAGLKARLRHKAQLSPGRWDLAPLTAIRTLTEFDDRYTAKDDGYAGAADYYDRAGARHVLHRIAVPTLIITAEDDPFIPITLFDHPAIADNPHITLRRTSHGGHCGFFQTARTTEDRFWAENRLLEWMTDPRAAATLKAPTATCRP